MMINVWIALREEAEAAIRERLTWDEETQGEYTGPVSNATYKIFDTLKDRDAVTRLFSKQTLAGKEWSLWSCNFESNKNVLSMVRAELDDLVATYPNRVSIVGAWHEDGRQVGTTFTYTDVPNPAYTGEPFMIPNPDYDPDPESPTHDSRVEIRNPLWVPEFITERGVLGTPEYPLPVQLAGFMPDGLTIQDVNLLYGQRPRDFT